RRFNCPKLPFDARRPKWDAMIRAPAVRGRSTRTATASERGGSLRAAAAGDLADARQRRDGGRGVRGDGDPDGLRFPALSLAGVCVRDAGAGDSLGLPAAAFQALRLDAVCGAGGLVDDPP